MAFCQKRIYFIFHQRSWSKLVFSVGNFSSQNQMNGFSPPCWFSNSNKMKQNRRWIFPHVSESRHGPSVSHLCLFFAGVGICQREGDTLTAAVIRRFLRSVNFPRPSVPPPILLLFLFSVCINNGWPQHSQPGWLTAVSSADWSEDGRLLVEPK